MEIHMSALESPRGNNRDQKKMEIQARLQLPRAENQEPRGQIIPGKAGTRLERTRYVSTITKIKRKIEQKKKRSPLLGSVRPVWPRPTPTRPVGLI